MNTLKISNLTKKFGSKTALNQINLELTPNVYGLIGANGAGKTTLLRCLTGLYCPKDFDIQYNDKSIYKQEEYWSQLGYLPQAFGLFRELTVCEVMMYFCIIKRVPKEQQQGEIERCLKAVHLLDRIDSRVRTLSGGMIRRLGIAQAFIGNTSIAFLDEPTSGLDPEERMRFKNMILEQSDEKIIMLSTHIIDDIEAVCGKVIVIGNGNILFCGETDDLRRKADKIIFELDEIEFKDLEQSVYLIKTTQKDNGVFRRVICREDVGISIEPTLEDGYFALMKGFVP